jgi:hypothetical protein
MMEAMGRFNDELVKAGIMKPGDCDGLTPSSRGKRVAFDGANREVIQGPFAHPRELVAGFWLRNVKDVDEAVAWVKRCPNPMHRPSERNPTAPGDRVLHIARANSLLTPSGPYTNSAVVTERAANIHQ